MTRFVGGRTSRVEITSFYDDAIIRVMVTWLFFSVMAESNPGSGPYSAEYLQGYKYA